MAWRFAAGLVPSRSRRCLFHNPRKWLQSWAVSPENLWEWLSASRGFFPLNQLAHFAMASIQSLRCRPCGAICLGVARNRVIILCHTVDVQYENVCAWSFLWLALSSFFDLGRGASESKGSEQKTSLHFVLAQSCQVPSQSKKLGAWGHDIVENKYVQQVLTICTFHILFTLFFSFFFQIWFLLPKRFPQNRRVFHDPRGRVIVLPCSLHPPLRALSSWYNMEICWWTWGHLRGWYCNTRCKASKWESMFWCGFSDGSSI